MKTPVICLVLLSGACAQDQLQDPAALMPKDLTIYAEAAAPSRVVEQFRKSPLFDFLAPRLPGSVKKALESLEQADLVRVAVGLDVKILQQRVKYVAFLEGKEPLQLQERVRPLIEGLRCQMEMRQGYLCLTDSRETLQELDAVTKGDVTSVQSRTDFEWFKSNVRTGDVRFHVNLGRLLPIRPGVEKPGSGGAAFLFGHLLTAAARTPALAGFLDVSQGLKLHLLAQTPRLSKSRAFAMPNETPLDQLASPDQCGARLSLRRDLSKFWASRETLVPKNEQGGFAEFQNIVSILTGGMTAEDVFAGLGPVFDVYLSRLPEVTPAPEHRFPMGAIVAQAKSEKLRGELVVGFQQLIGFINADYSQKNLPRLLIQTEEHRGVKLHVASFQRLPETADDRLQLLPALAVVGERVILGTHGQAVRNLVDQAVDGKTEPRLGGDSLHMMAANVITMLEENLDALVGLVTLNSGGRPERTREIFQGGLELARKVKDLTLNVHVQEGDSVVHLDVRAPSLLQLRGTQK